MWHLYVWNIVWLTYKCIYTANFKTYTYTECKKSNWCDYISCNIVYLISKIFIGKIAQIPYFYNKKKTFAFLKLPTSKFENRQKLPKIKNFGNYNIFIAYCIALWKRTMCGEGGGRKRHEKQAIFVSLLLCSNSKLITGSCRL